MLELKQINKDGRKLSFQELGFQRMRHAQKCGVAPVIAHQVQRNGQRIVVANRRGQTRIPDKVGQKDILKTKWWSKR